MKTKEVASEQPKLSDILDRIEEYRKQLHDSPKVSATKFGHMQTALHWAKQIVRDCYGVEREKNATAWVK